MTEGPLVLAITIAGDPTTKARPRVVDGRAFTPSRTRRAEASIQRSLLTARFFRNETDALAVSLAFRSATAQRRDLDNLIKLVLDACNTIVWADDFQVIEIHATVSRRDAAPGFDLVVESLGPMFGACQRCERPLVAGQARFCGRECTAADQRRGATIPCSHCGKPVYRQAERVANAATFCGPDCRRGFLAGVPRAKQWSR